MTESPEFNHPTPEDLRQQRRRQRWRLYGWTVIALLGISIMLNLLNVLDPEVNKILLPAVIGAYVIYVIFRGR